MQPTLKSENRKLISQLAKLVTAFIDIVVTIVEEQRAQARSAKLHMALTKRLISYCMAEKDAGSWPETLSIDGDPSRPWALPEPEQVPPSDRAAAEAEIAKLSAEEKSKRAALKELRNRIKVLGQPLDLSGPEVS